MEDPIKFEPSKINRQFLDKLLWCFDDLGISVSLVEARGMCFKVTGITDESVITTTITVSSNNADLVKNVVNRGSKSRPRSKKSNLVEAVRALLTANYTQNQIADMLNISQSYVSMLANKRDKDDQEQES